MLSNTLLLISDSSSTIPLYILVLSIRRHDPDLNREALADQAFQACAIPGYAIVATKKLAFKRLYKNSGSVVFLIGIISKFLNASCSELDIDSPRSEPSASVVNDMVSSLDS